MQNRFLDSNTEFADRDQGLAPFSAPHERWKENGSPGRGNYSTPSSLWSRSESAADRTLVVLIENGGVDLGIPALVDFVLSKFPGASTIFSGSVRDAMVDFLRAKIKEFTDNLLETAELMLNRYTAARPDLFNDVVVLRNGTAFYADLKNTLISLSRAGKVIDLMILTHGGSGYLVAGDTINGDNIRAIRAEYGKPLSLRSVYMMNCVGSSLNKAWLDAGAKASCGTTLNNYLPEPTTFFFWNNWKNGQGFETAATSAYYKTIKLMNDAVAAFIDTVGIPLAPKIDFGKMDFVAQSSPVVQGQKSITINTDDLTLTQSVASSLATTVLPVDRLLAISGAQDDGATRAARSLSRAGMDFIKGWEKFMANLYNDVAGHCTVGYGTLVHQGKCDGRDSEGPYLKGVSEADATEMLKAKAARFQDAINQTVTVALNQNQNDALVSFVYNVGEGAFRSSTLLKLLNQGKYDAVPTELKKWVKARKDGKVVEVPGLVNRRAAEVDLFQKAPTATSQSLSGNGSVVRHSYTYHSPSLSTSQSKFSYMQNPAAVVIPVLGEVALADAAQIGLGATAIVQSQVNASGGTFTLMFDKAQRLLTNEARSAMPGAQSSRQTVTRTLFTIGTSFPPGLARATIVAIWDGNPYGEIGTVIMRRDLPTSTEWSSSAASFNITKIDRIPLPDTDPRTWPITFSYEGTYNPWANGYFEFNGEFEVNAFGGLKFNQHNVLSRSTLDFAIVGKPEDYVQKGQDIIVSTPAIPQEQIDYLRKRLP